MKKHSLARIVFRSFFKTMGIMLLFVAAGVLSYYLTMLYYKQTDRAERSTQYTHVIGVNTGSESGNLIYSYDEKTKKIKAMVLELFDETTGNLSYITIPANTQITISGETYKEFLEVSQKVPQVALLSDINEYFSGDVAYEYGIRILQEEFQADIGYFTAISSDRFNTYFEKSKNKKKAYQPSKALLDSAAKCESGGDMKDFMETMWDELISDITLRQKQKYAEALTKVNRDYIRVYAAYGKKSGKVYTLNRRRNKKLVNRIWESEAYTGPQYAASDGSKDNSTAEAFDRSIQITNGSGINGLAAKYQQKFTESGFQVIGVGNYVGNLQTTTTIYARRAKWGNVFKKYFKNPTVMEADNLTNGADVEIVLGTEDDMADAQ